VSLYKIRRLLLLELLLIKFQLLQGLQLPKFQMNPPYQQQKAQHQHHKELLQFLEDNPLLQLDLLVQLLLLAQQNPDSLLLFQQTQLEDLLHLNRNNHQRLHHHNNLLQNRMNLLQKQNSMN
jgi:hypothetical protein